MKIWFGFGSEHSANIRMIGHFTTAEDAAIAKQQLEELCELIVKDYDHNRFEENPMDFYRDDKLRERLESLRLYHLSPHDLAGLAGDHRIDRHGNDLRIWTDEVELSGLLKFLIDRPSRVEVYSLHDFPDEDPRRR